MAGQSNFLIIGGGIGGLAAAVALRRRGIAAHTCEQAEELKEIGAGLSVWPNATWVLREFGLLTKALSRGSRIDQFRLQTSQGQLLSETTAPGKFGTPSIGIHRADLLNVLKDALPPEASSLGMRFEKLKESRGEVVAEFANGQSRTAGALIGADGLYSGIRAQILGPAEPAYRGYQAWRGVARFQLPDKLLATACETWGAGTRFGTVPMGEGRCFWYATQNAPKGMLGEPADWKIEVKKIFGSWPTPISEIVAATPGDAILKHEVFDRPPVRAIGVGCVTLLGDAANPTTPNLGQGACMALEDAFVLAECVAAENDIPEALREYESRRYARRKFITLESRRIGRMAQWENGATMAARSLLVRFMPAAISDFQHRRYYAFPH